MIEKTLIRENLMEREGYSPYCGSDKCFLINPRTLWDSNKKQFKCKCGWVSKFDEDFIERYINKWKKDESNNT